LGGKKGIWPVKTEWWGAGMVICLERGADLHMAQLTPLPLTISYFSKIQIGFTFLVPDHPGNPGEGQLNGCVCVCVSVYPYSFTDQVTITMKLQRVAALQLVFNCRQIKEIKPKNKISAFSD